MPNPDQQCDTRTAGADFGVPPTDSLPRQASDVPVTGSPGRVPEPIAHTESHSRPYRTEGGKLREDAHHPDTPTPEHRQSGSKYARKFRQGVETSTQTTTTDSADHTAPSADSNTPVSDEKPPAL